MCEQRRQIYPEVNIKRRTLMNTIVSSSWTARHPFRVRMVQPSSACTALDGDSVSIGSRR